MQDQMNLHGDDLCPEITGKCRIEGIGNVFIMLTNKEIEHFNPVALLKKQIGICLPAKTMQSPGLVPSPKGLLMDMAFAVNAAVWEQAY